MGLLRRTMIACATSMLLATSAYAEYECWAPTPLKNELRNADVVFTGKLVGRRSLGRSAEELNTARTSYVFDVYDIYKGLPAGTQKAEADTEAFYQYSFKNGEYYLVIGYRMYPKRISMIGCPRIKSVKEIYPMLSRFFSPEYSIAELPGAVTGREVPETDTPSTPEAKKDARAKEIIGADGSKGMKVDTSGLPKEEPAKAEPETAAPKEKEAEKPAAQPAVHTDPEEELVKQKIERAEEKARKEIEANKKEDDAKEKAEKEVKTEPVAEPAAPTAPAPLPVVPALPTASDLPALPEEPVVKKEEKPAAAPAEAPALPGQPEIPAMPQMPDLPPSP